MEIQQRLKELRNALKLTQTEFGEKLGKKYRTIQQYEDGTTKPDNIVWELLKTFNVNPFWLMNGEGEMFIQEDIKQKDSRNALITNALQHISDEEKDFILKYIDERVFLKKALKNQLNKKFG